MEITIEAPIGKVLKAPEKFRLVSSFVQAFKGVGIAQVQVKDSSFIDRRSPAVPEEGVMSMAIGLSVDGASVQIIEALDSLIEDGKLVGKKLAISLGPKALVDMDGNLVVDDYITKLIWDARNSGSAAPGQIANRLALVYGSVVYYAWSNEVIPVIVTLTSPDLVRDVIEGRRRGLVACVRVKWFSCSICGENTDDCEHKIGEKYDDKVCVAIPRDVQFLEESVTSELVDPRCNISDLLMFGKDRSEYEWYGFQNVNILDRLKNINNAKNDKVISQEAASKFRLYFSRHSVGRCKFRPVKPKPKAQVASRRK